jgi:NADP-dependent 3-hydroxy acid dehydrogenase YdfG
VASVWQRQSVFSKKGARVAISGRSKKTLDEAVRTIGNGVLAIQADVAKLAELDKLYTEVSQKLGKIDAFGGLGRI